MNGLFYMLNVASTIDTLTHMIIIDVFRRLSIL